MFAHSIRVAPDSSASKWMYSAQCEDDPKAAVAAFTRGIRILSAQRESLPPPTSAVDEGEEVSSHLCVALPSRALIPVRVCICAQDPSTLLNTVNTQLISAYCSVAELYMTDLW